MTVRKFLRLGAGLAVVALAVIVLTSKPEAQGTVTVGISKYTGQAWPAGPDYATDVLGDPWDFSNDDDVFPDPGELTSWQTLFLNGHSYPRTGQTGGNAGMVGGRTQNQNGQPSTINLLFRGRYSILNPDRTGREFPINTSTYQKLSYRMSSSAGGFGGWVLWFPFPWNDPALPQSDPNDGGGRFLPTNVAGHRIYETDLMGDSFGNGRTWNSTGTIRGLRIAPNLNRWNDDIFYDWVRLTAPDGSSSAAHMQTISWSGGGSGNATIEVLDSSNTVLSIASNRGGSSYLWNYGVLPPGSYTLRVTRSGGGTGTRTFTIAAPPVITMAKPSKEGDEDFATTVLGSAWDMNESTDVLITGHENYTPSPAIFDGMMHAVNTGHPVGGGSDPLGDDPQIWLLDYTNNTNGRTINTQRYRYFTVRYDIDDPDNTREWGIGRVFWTAQQFLNANTGTNTKDIDIWPGFHSYTVDLATLNTTPDGGLEPTGNPIPWTSANMTSFRFDPSEYWSQRWFHIDHIYLRAMAETTGGGYTFRWTYTGSGNATMSLYLDSDKNPNNGKTLIASNIDIDDGTDSNGYFWSQGNTTPGDYHVYFEATDSSTNPAMVRGRYGDGPLKVLNFTPTGNPLLRIDTPSEGDTVNTTFPISGWAVDLNSTNGPGVDVLHIWAFPQGSSAGQFVGEPTYLLARGDIGNLYGSRFTNSGYSMTGSLSPGNYLLLVYMHSTVTGTFNRVAGHNIRVQAPQTEPYTRIDTPLFFDTRSASQPFAISGWAVDRGSTSGTGVNLVHIWAFQNGQQPGTFICGNGYGLPRPDIANVFGHSRFTNSGYSCTVPANTFQPGTQWFFVVFGNSSVTGSFSQSAGAWVTFQ